MTRMKSLGRSLVTATAAILINGALVGWLLSRMPEGPRERPVPATTKTTVARAKAEPAPRPKPAEAQAVKARSAEPTAADPKAWADLAEATKRADRLAAVGWTDREGSAPKAEARPGPLDSRPDGPGSAGETPGERQPKLRDRRAEALAQYAARQATTPDEPEPRRAFAAWCDTNGLWDEARAQWEALLKLKPDHEAARKRLGYRRRGGVWILDVALAEESARKKAEAYWSKALASDHGQMHLKKRPDAARLAAEAALRVESVRDARAVPALWHSFAGDQGHHVLLVKVLSAIDSPGSSKILAGLAVYSLDEKARIGALLALRRRDDAPFRGQLVSLIAAPLRTSVREVPDGAGGLARALFIEDERANYQLLYPTQRQSQPDAFCSVNAGYLAVNTRAALQQFNRAQEQAAREFSDQQLESDRAAVAALNQSIRQLNERVARVLGETSGARFRPDDPEPWRRWLAARDGTTYRPINPGEKVTIAQVVEPLYSPTFLPVPAPS